MIADTAPPAPSLTRLAKVLPFALLAVMAATAYAWNIEAGVTWQWPNTGQLMLLLLPCWIIAAYAYLRGIPKLAEVSAFMAVYFLYSFYGTRLTYIVSTLDYPFIDAKLQAFDAAIGFHWGQWQHFVSTHPYVYDVHAFVYPTHFFQIAFCVVIFSYFRPGLRNYEMLFLMTAGVIVAITIFAIFPTLGPATSVGIKAPHEAIIDALRLGRGVSMPYTGLISFPSFHTFMAITFVYCNRGIRQSFIPVAVWNAIMLFTLPYGGDHNIADLLGGATVAGLSILAARRLYP